VYTPNSDAGEKHGQTGCRYETHKIINTHIN